MKADINDPNAPGGQNAALALLWFPYVVHEQPQTVPVTFTLLDEIGNLTRGALLRSWQEVIASF